MVKIKIRELFEVLLKEYGPQGWWPLDCKYHKGDYNLPKTLKQKYEVCLGSILTQNTSWKNVAKALKQLREKTNLDPEKILEMNLGIRELIRPAGYYNQKAKKIIIFTEHFLDDFKPERDYLLNIWGIGKETADSILLYAYKQNVFVVDAYTKRIFERVGITKEKDYDKIKALVEKEINDYKELNEFHALLVEHAKRFCTKKPNCKDCFLSKLNLCKLGKAHKQHTKARK